MTTTLLFLAGSLRKASSSKAVVETLCEELKDEIEIRRFDIGALPHYNADLPLPESVETFKAEIDAADGLVIVTPEYNFSVPGVLKNAIDWASRPAYNSVMKGKPVIIASVSGGALGGVRAQSHLKYALDGMLAHVFVWQEMVVPHANKKVKNGRLVDEATESFILDGIRAFIESLRTPQ